MAPARTVRFAEVTDYAPSHLMHPLLTSSVLCFDMTLSSKHVRVADPRVLFEPATRPVVNALEIIHPALPHSIRLVAQRDLPYLRQSFDALSSSEQVSVLAAFRRRCQSLPIASQEAERRDGLRLVDFLTSTTAFAGLSRSKNPQITPGVLLLDLAVL
ncbi:hypothetical protein C8F01DRAFT_1380914 [Mycena amicta]|nr:hypothetical protein C8F01DRAFT_1380914 [Mycena amicta]